MGRPRHIFDIAMVTVLDSIKISLAGKLIVALGLLIFIGGGISWYWLIAKTKRT